MSGANATANIFLALNAEGGVPSEIMLLPAGAVLATVDGRGPWRVRDAAKLVAASLQAARGRPMPIDENHSTDLKAPKGEPSPARGWMTGLQARADGIWAPVEWTDEGKHLVGTKAYRTMSVVFDHLADGTITCIKRAALVNNPNLRDIVALNAEGTNMEELMKKLCAFLGLKEDADDDSIYLAVRALQDAATVERAKAASVTALQASIASIAKIAGLTEDAKPDAVLAAVTTFATTRAAPGAEVISGLQAELATVTTALNAVTKERATEKATAFVDGAIKAGRVGLKPNRIHYIERYALNAEGAAAVEKEINAMPILGASGALTTPPEIKDGKVALNAAQKSICTQLGISEDAYAKQLATEQAA